MNRTTLTTYDGRVVTRPVAPREVTHGRTTYMLNTKRARLAWMLGWEWEQHASYITRHHNGTATLSMAMDADVAL